MTRGDVAALAATSPAVVSYVINGGPRPVAEGTRRRVLAAIDELGYRPNSIARSLRTRRTMTLGLIVPDTANPFFGDASRAIEDAAYRLGYMVVLGNAKGSSERQSSYIRTLIDQQVDGLLILPQYGTVSWEKEVADSGVPCVVLDRPLPSGSFPTVGVNNIDGMARAVRHLTEVHGRRRIACVAGPEDSGPMDERVAGWRGALESLGMSAEGLLRRGGFHREDGIAMVAEMVAEGADFDAVVVASDEQAFGVLRALYDHGLRVPDDVSVIGFDGVNVAHSVIPSLTTVQRPFDEIARLAVELLLSDPPAAPEMTRLPVTLTLGESCGCTRRRGEGHG
ncbi:MAG: LacI family DNA-binding transcriptional regulator [Microbacteriaceae bacterium]|nr:LacI family DNA-binding transcriptional regulator [Microbacteriaceae bacterium]